jgi:hypothetical protein
MLTDWKLPSPSDLLQHIEWWRSFDQTSTSQKEIESTIIELRDRIKRAVTTKRSKQYHSLWRVQAYKEKDHSVRDWSSIDALLYPPAKLANLGRCNQQCEQILYTATRGETAFDEVGERLCEGTEAVLVEFRATRPLILDVLVGDFCPVNVESRQPVFTGEELVSYQILREFIRSEFMRPVGASTEYLYRVSAAICKHWTSNDNKDGWVYPSVDSAGGENVALKRDAVDEGLVVASAWRGYVESLTSAPFLKGKCVSGVTFRFSHQASIASRRIEWMAAEKGAGKGFFRVKKEGSE